MDVEKDRACGWPCGWKEQKWSRELREKGRDGGEGEKGREMKEEMREGESGRKVDVEPKEKREME